MATNVMDTLRARGFIKQTVFEDELYEKLGKESLVEMQIRTLLEYEDSRACSSRQRLQRVRTGI